MYDAAGNYAAFACTAGDGSYTTPALPSGSYQVGFASQFGYCGGGTAPIIFLSSTPTRPL